MGSGQQYFSIYKKFQEIASVNLHYLNYTLKTKFNNLKKNIIK